MPLNELIVSAREGFRHRSSPDLPALASVLPRRAMAASALAAIPPVWITMAKIFSTIFSVVYALSLTLTPVRSRRTASGSSAPRWLADPRTNPSKHHAEVFILKYSAAWILSVGVVIASRAFEWWGPWGYMVYCVSCAAPYLLYPLARPLPGDASAKRRDWYILKANVWIAVFSFIGNYWYTHYFYGVLKADYTFEAHRLNDVPIALYFMTHAYFMFYHVLSNCALRRVRSGFEPDVRRFAFECALIGAMAYTTAFMESLTICGFPYYRFENRDMAYTLGSAFYGIYFLVSFPMFLRVDEAAGGGRRGEKAAAMTTTFHQTFWEAMGSGMAVLCLLDFVRLALGIDFVMKAGGH